MVFGKIADFVACFRRFRGLTGTGPRSRLMAAKAVFSATVPCWANDRLHHLVCFVEGRDAFDRQAHAVDRTHPHIRHGHRPMARLRTSPRRVFWRASAGVDHGRGRPTHRLKKCSSRSNATPSCDDCFAPNRQTVTPARSSGLVLPRLDHPDDEFGFADLDSVDDARRDLVIGQPS